MKKRIIILVLLLLVAFPQDMDAKKKTKGKSKKVSRVMKMKNKTNLRYNNKSSRQKLDIYYPKKVKRNNDNPVVLFIHGGSFMVGNKRDYIGANRSQFTKRGYVYIPVGYRLSKDKKFPAAIDDTKTAIRYLKNNRKKFKINPNKIIIVGYSAGANLGAIVASTPTSKRIGNEKIKYARHNSRVAGFIGVAGFYDYDTLYEDYGKNNYYHSVHKAILQNFVNKDDKVQSYNLKRADPKNYIGKMKTPVMLQYGALDRTIPPSQSSAYCKSLKGVGNKNVSCYRFKSYAHGFSYFKNKANYNRIVRWMNKVVR